MRAAALSFLAFVTLAVTACTGGAGGPGTEPGGTGQQGTGGGGDGAGGGDGDGKGGATAGGGTTAAIPDVFYGKWAYMHATLYQDGEEPIISDVPGTAVFQRDLTYAQSYMIGTVTNHYSGRYEIDATRLKTYDEQGEQAFDFRWQIGDDPTVGAPVLTLTLDDDQGNPSIVYALEAAERD